MFTGHVVLASPVVRQMGGGSSFARDGGVCANANDAAKPLRQPAAATSPNLTVGEAFCVRHVFVDLVGINAFETTLSWVNVNLGYSAY